MTQAKMLIQLRQPTPMRALAGLLACDASNITGLVDPLEHMDWSPGSSNRPTGGSRTWSRRKRAGGRPADPRRYAGRLGSLQPPRRRGPPQPLRVLGRLHPGETA